MNTKYCFNKDCIRLSKEYVANDDETQRINNNVLSWGDDFNLGFDYYDFAGDAHNHVDYIFDGGGFNFANALRLSISAWYEPNVGIESSAGIFFDMTEMIFNTGNITFNTDDIMMINLLPDGNSKTQFDFTDTISLDCLRYNAESNSTLNSTLEVTEQKVNIRVRNNDEQHDYAFQSDGLYVNDCAPNTADGIVMLDSNSHLPSNVLNGLSGSVTKVLANYTSNN